MEQDTTTFSPPYGPVSNLKTIFDTWRDRSMPEQIDKDWLERAGISANLAPKNLQALRFLGLIDADGYTTAVATRLRGAAAEEYPSVLEEIVRKAYRPIFELRNPSEDSRNRVEDAFRKLEPQAQRGRMVACFLGLCAMALIPLKEAPPVREISTRVSGRVRPKVMRNVTDTISGRVEIRPRTTAPTSVAPAVMDPVLRGLIEKLLQIEDAVELDDWFQVFKSAFVYVKSARKKLQDEARE